MQSSTEEDYLKAIFKLSKGNKQSVSTNAIAESLNTKASSVSDMIKKLNAKGFVDYKKYQGVSLLEKGEKIAVHVIRKHRLWEVFLVDKLGFKWDEIHEIAEQLEHIKSPELVDRLDEHLNFPKMDPHGDPIPDKNGKFHTVQEVSLEQLKIGESGILIGVKEHSKEFLRYLDNLEIKLGQEIKVIDKFKFDNSLVIKTIGKNITLSNQVSSNLNVTLLDI